MHVEQIDAVAQLISNQYDVHGISIFEKSNKYNFGTLKENNFTKEYVVAENAVTIMPSYKLFFSLLKKSLNRKNEYIFISHYERSYIFLYSSVMNLFGKKLILLNDSKFDDYPRNFWRELGKRILYLPYHGGIAASVRSADYLRFLGIRKDRIRLDCYTADLSRIRALAGGESAPLGTPYDQRHFLCVARLVPKKNLETLVGAYALYAANRPAPRKLIICGEGEQREALIAQSNALAVDQHIEFRGNVPSDGVARSMADALCLLLPSKEEQFGIVVLEALALGLPIILGENCGARDRHVRAGVNGFVVEPDNIEGLAYFMTELADNEALWRKMSMASSAFAERGDTARFVESVLSFLD